MRHNKVVVPLHFVWSTWDRLPLVTQEIERDLYRYISQVCQDDGSPVLAIGGMPDHVHLLVEFPATKTFAQLMHDVKGGSSRFVSNTLKPGEWFAWQGHYAVFAVSPRDKPKVINYILHQKDRHASNNLWPSVEDFDNDDADEGSS
jgi:REP element-mobilizing transposase RayT